MKKRIISDVIVVVFAAVAIMPVAACLLSENFWLFLLGMAGLVALCFLGTKFGGRVLRACARINAALGIQ